MEHFKTTEQNREKNLRVKDIWPIQVSLILKLLQRTSERTNNHKHLRQTSQLSIKQVHHQH